MLWGVSHLKAVCVCVVSSGKIIFVLSYLKDIFHNLRVTNLLGLLSA